MADELTIAGQRSRSLRVRDEEHREFLVFRMAGELFAVALRRVREIVSPPPMTPVPRGPATVLGLCSVRGMLVTVFDLRKRLRLPAEAPNRRNRILLVDGREGEVVGLFVDDVSHVARLRTTDIEPAAAALGSEVGEHVLGIARPGSQVIVLLNLDPMVGV